jgi:hypothetical protein
MVQPNTTQSSAMPFFLNEEEPLIIDDKLLEQHQNTAHKEEPINIDLHDVFVLDHHDDQIIFDDQPQQQTPKSFSNYVTQDLYIGDFSFTLIDDITREILLATEQ